MLHGIPLAVSFRQEAHGEREMLHQACGRQFVACRGAMRALRPLLRRIVPAKVRAMLRGFVTPKRPRLRRKFNINQFTEIFIDPAFNICQLTCPYCPVGTRLKLGGMARGLMSLDDFRAIWDRSLTGFRGELKLYNWGEAFLNPALPDIIAFIKAHPRVTVTLNSNFSFRFDGRMERIMESLDRDLIIISCDGFSQATCEQYRKGVRFEKVIHNIELMRKKRKPETRLSWQYLLFPWNQDEVESARAFCEAREIHFYTAEGGITPNYPMLPTPSSRDKKLQCDRFLDALCIDAHGDVYPCCAYYGPAKYSLGNAKTQSLEAIFTAGKGKEMVDYLTGVSGGTYDLFCRHCMERNVNEFESWGTGRAER